MFTGLVEETGSMLRSTPVAGGLNITLSCSQQFSEGIKIGDSVAVNGCCLTAVEKDSSSVTFNAVNETVAKSNLSFLNRSSVINMERALKIGDRLGGHFVQGHVDGIGEFLSGTNVGMEWRMKIRVPSAITNQCIQKGSIAINGISLTIAKLEDGIVEVAVIPHTKNETNLEHLRPGDKINIETDMLGKWVKKLLTGRPEPKSSIDQNFLRENGFI